MSTSAVTSAEGSVPPDGDTETATRKTYLRFGWWCRCERSCNSVRGQLERGVSVYEHDEGGPPWRPKAGRAWEKNKSSAKSPDGVWLFVEATPIGQEGGDGEPLVAKVKPLRKLEWRDSVSGFVDAGEIEQQFANHRGFEVGDCRCLNVFELATQDPYADDGDEDEYEDEDEDEDDHHGEDVAT